MSQCMPHPLLPPIILPSLQLLRCPPPLPVAFSSKGDFFQRFRAAAVLRFLKLKPLLKKSKNCE